jgi:putative ABC transport system permease protein
MLNDIFFRLRSLFRRHAVEQELDDELRFHREQQVESYVRAGLSRDDAVRRAQIEFGGLEQIKEAHRDARGIGLVEEFGRDARYAVRQLWRSPGFAIAALLCLGIGIGATTAIFSVVNAVLLQPLPFPESDRLVRMVENIPPPVRGRPPLQRGLTVPEFLEWRAQSKTLSDAYAVTGLGQRLVRTTHGAVGLWGAMASTNAFALVQAPAMFGRTLDVSDEADPNVVVLSHDTWQRHFNGDPSAVGKAIEFRAAAVFWPTQPRLMTVVGVLPAGVTLPDGAADFYWPMTNAAPGRVTLIGQLAPGVSMESAIAEANAMGTAIRPSWPAEADPLTVPRFEVQRLKDRTVERVRPALQVFLVAVVVVLLIVCANVANLLLARGTVRRREIAMRLSIGATRGRVVRQMLTESLVLALAGGAIGALLGAAGVSLIRQMATIEAPGIYRLMFGSTILPRAHEVAVDFRMLGIAFGLATITSVMFGLLPALTLSRANQVAAMGSRGSGTGPGESWVRAALVVGQFVMATVLLVSAGLLAHSFVKMSSASNNGYDPSNVVTFNLLQPDQYSIRQKVDTVERLLTRLRALPNVTAAGSSRHGVLIGEEIMQGTFVPPGRSLDEMRSSRTRFRPVSGGYLTAMGVPVLDGRELGPRDDAGAPPVLVMNRSAARQYFGDARPVGQVVDWHFGAGRALQMTVVGVVEDVRQESPTDEVFPEVFVDYRQFLSVLEIRGESALGQNVLAIGLLSFAIRTSDDPAAAIPLVREIVNSVDANVGIDALVPMSRLATSAVAPQRFYAVTLGVFAGVAAILAAVGIYGLLTYAVIQRTQEIGIRMTIGAQRAQVLALVLRRGLTLAAVGIALGIIASAASTRVLEGLLFGVTPLDSRTFLFVSLLFALIAVFASYLPARRATRVDPLVALRSE